jgi:hypothetical protein
MPTLDYSQQVNAAFTFLRKGLRTFVEQEMKAVYKDRWFYECERAGAKSNREGLPELDNSALLKIIGFHWERVFKMDHRRGPKERGAISELIEWRHKLEGHRTQDVPKQEAVDFIVTVVYTLKCIDAKDEAEAANNLLQSLSFLLPETEPVLPQKPLPHIEPKIESSPHISVVDVAALAENEPLPTGRTIDFWGAYHFDFSDALNEEIWLLSSDLQQQVQPIDTIKLPGIIGAQQAMLDSNLLAERGPLPWVPDLVGNEWQNQNGIVIIGSAYAGFVREYSTRSATMPLSQYLAASSVKDFQNLFLRYVVRGDPGYYTPIQNLCSDLGNASRLSLVDLCRVSLVERGVGVQKRSDGSSGIVTKAPAVFEKYVENKQASEWLWRRFVDGQAKCVLALGSIAEHGLLRLFSRHGMTIMQDGEPFDVSPIAMGGWANEYADPSRKLSYWLNHETWWTVRGYVDEIERIWYVMPVYHPARHANYDVGYKRTKTVLKLMQASI